MRYYHHFVEKYPPDESIFGRIVSNVMFFVAVTLRTLRAPLLSKEDVNAARAILKPGDIILVGDGRRFISFFIPDVVTHSLLYIGDDTMVHSEADGVEKMGLDVLPTEYDSMAVIRPRITDEQRSLVTVRALELVGKPYDFWFSEGTKALYCTEVLTESFSAVQFDVGFSEHDSRRWIFKGVRRPVDFAYAKNCDVVFLSKHLRMENGALSVV